MCKVKNKMISFVKRRIEKYINKKNTRLSKKIDKHHQFSDWYYCVVCASKYKQVSFKKRIQMYLKGFTSDDYLRYNLNVNNSNDYITELERWNSRKINGMYNVVLDDKRLFYEVFSKHLNIPKTLFLISDNKIIDNDTTLIININNIIESLKEYKGLVFRPLSSGGGKGINIIKFIDGKYYLNDEKVSKKDLEIFIGDQRDCIVSQYLFQHEYSNKIYSKAVNTIRIVTIQDDKKGAIIPLALHRFGTDESCPVDNVCSGGIFASVDVETGVLSEAKSYRKEGAFENHPDTGVKIKGIKIPNWNFAKEEIIKVANKFSYIPFVAWDVVITNDGISVIEGNASTGIAIFQMFKPERKSVLGEFYKNKGVIK